MTLLLDEMYAPAIAAELRARQHDVVSIHDTSMAGASDLDVFTAARRQSRTLVTENVRDYRPLEVKALAEGDHHAGLIYTNNRHFPRGDPTTTGRLVHALDTLLSIAPDLRDRSIFLRPE